MNILTREVWVRKISCLLRMFIRTQNIFTSGCLEDHMNGKKQHFPLKDHLTTSLWQNSCFLLSITACIYLFILTHWLYKKSSSILSCSYDHINGTELFFSLAIHLDTSSVQNSYFLFRYSIHVTTHLAQNNCFPI